LTKSLERTIREPEERRHKKEKGKDRSKPNIGISKERIEKEKTSRTTGRRPRDATRWSTRQGHNRGWGPKREGRARNIKKD